MKFYLGELFSLALLVEVSRGDLLWGGNTCNAMLEEENSQIIRGTACVAPGTLHSDYPKCVECVFDYQCSSNWCHESWKVCTANGEPCNMKPDAFCNNCPSDVDTNLGECECDEERFPNEWVECTDDTPGYDTYSLEAYPPYESKRDASSGALLEDDLFAIQAQCYHNKYRVDAAGVGSVSWNMALAQFATNWSLTQKEELGCKMTHSKNSQRENLGTFGYSGENLYSWSTTGTVKERDIAKFGEKATSAWYNEIKWYQYGGEDHDFQYCDFRNDDKGKAQIGHLTQLLWESTTDIGCDYVICNDKKVLVTCIYGPGGNYVGQPPFDEDAYCQLQNYPDNIEKFEGFPSCVPRLQGICDDTDTTTEAAVETTVKTTVETTSESTTSSTSTSTTTTEPTTSSTTTTDYESSGKDGICAGQYGGTCTFPWHYSGLGTFYSCQDSIDRLIPSEPWCFSEVAGYFDLCKQDDSDPDCKFEYVF